MTEDLQHLLDKIQKDGVEKAESEATSILQEAKSKAEKIVQDAKKQADDIIAKAEKDSVAFEEKGRKSLEQAARDVVISARTGIQNALNAVILAEASAAMDDATVSSMLTKVVDAYCDNPAETELRVSEADVEQFKGYVLSKLSQKAAAGITVQPDKSIAKGFKVVLKDKNIEHDLTDEAVGEALARLLRPYIAEILKKTS